MWNIYSVICLPKFLMFISGIFVSCLFWTKTPPLRIIRIKNSWYKLIMSTSSQQCTSPPGLLAEPIAAGMSPPVPILSPAGRLLPPACRCPRFHCCSAGCCMRRPRLRGRCQFTIATSYGDRVTPEGPPSSPIMSPRAGRCPCQCCPRRSRC
jgi:hypothetical protein